MRGEEGEVGSSSWQWAVAERSALILECVNGEEQVYLPTAYPARWGLTPSTGVDGQRKLQPATIG